jgi:hypothetical protein
MTIPDTTPLPNVTLGLALLKTKKKPGNNFVDQISFGEHPSSNSIAARTNKNAVTQKNSLYHGIR